VSPLLFSWDQIQTPKIEEAGSEKTTAFWKKRSYWNPILEFFIQVSGQNSLTLAKTSLSSWRCNSERGFFLPSSVIPKDRMPKREAV